MANVVISGDTSGSVTLAAPNVAGSNTITLAAQTGTLNVAGPTFSAYYSGAGQSINNNTATKVVFNVESFDTNSNYDATNYRFTPTIAGYYLITGTINYTGTTYAGIFLLSLYRNGTIYDSGRAYAINGGSASITHIIFLNGSTDYVEFYATQTQGTAQTITPILFDGCLVRGA